MGILTSIAYYNFLGIPLVIYGGIITLTMVIITAVLGTLVLKGKLKFKWHKIFAIITIIIACMHGFLAFGSRYL